MATLTVNGQQVKVDDSFLKLSPAQQEATVNEIAKSLKTAPGPRATPTPTVTTPDGRIENANPMAAAPEAPGNGMPPASLDDYVRSFGANIDQIPGGNFVYDWMRKARAGAQSMTPEQVDAETAQARARAPAADVAGKLFYNIAPYAAAGAAAPKLFGMGEAVPFSAGFKPVVLDTLGRAGAAALSNEVIGTADSIGRGQDPLQAAQANLVPSLAIGGLPIAGATIRGIGRVVPKLASWATGDIAPTIKAFWNPEAAGQKAVGRAMAADKAAGLTMSPADEAFARANGLDINNLDLGGPATRNLARTAKAGSPEANAALVGAVDRGAPGVDTAAFLTKLVGGSADDLALRQGLQDQAKLVNGPAYRKAYSAPGAQSIWSQDLAGMFQAPEFAKAVRDAEATGRTRAAIQGGRSVQNPFVFNPDGTVSMKPGVTPSLEFWDKVKINLDRQAQALGPQERSALADITGLKTKLVGVLDNAVPAYRTARQGAAGFFGAEDAMDAGRQFAMQPRNLPEAKAAIAKMSPAEQKAFAIGAASTAVDALKSKDTFASVKQVFGNPNAREFWQTTLGPAKAAQLEAYVKVQAIQEASKQAVLGGSQTYDLLLGGGLATGGFVANQAGINPGGASTAAMFVGAARLARGTLGRLVDRQVLTKAAELLASNDKAALTKVIANATLSPKWKAAIDAIFEGVAATARGGTLAAIGPSAAAASIPYPQTDTRDYSNGVPPAISQGPRASFVPQVAR